MARCYREPSLILIHLTIQYFRLRTELSKIQAWVSTRYAESKLAKNKMPPLLYTNALFAPILRSRLFHEFHSLLKRITEEGGPVENHLWLRLRSLSLSTA